jgi:iron complex outermembrane recepter protein
MNPTTARLAALLGSASFITIANMVGAHGQVIAPATLLPGTQSQGQDPADTLLTSSPPQKVAQVQPQQQVAQSQPSQPASGQSSQGRPALAAQAATTEAVPTVSVVITGSLIAGTQAIGVPVTNLGVQDFVQSGALTTGELFRTIPAAQVSPGASAVINGGQQERQTRVNLRGLDTTGPRALLMVDGFRFPPQADGLCVIDPSIIPALAVDRIDVLADGASATYGSDAISGVINVVLKRAYDGATTLLHVQAPDSGGLQWQASQLWGRTWDGGDVTLTYEWLDEKAVSGTAHSKYTIDYTPWGLNNASPIGISIPGTITAGKPKGVGNGGIYCTNCYAIPAGTGQDYTQTPGPAFDWSALQPGTNVLDPLKLGDEIGSEQKNSFVATFDQRLFSRDGLLPGVSFFFTGFYTNRRVEFHNSPYYSNGSSNDYKTYTVPTSNPYYPTGVPTSVQASGLQVSFDLATEAPISNHAYEVADRYSFGFNLDLPFNWQGKLYDSRSYDANSYYLHLVNKAYVDLALGNTAAVPGAPGVTFAKPAGVPYLNIFCDPTAYDCNSPTTLRYIEGTRHIGEVYQLEEKGANFNGPLFDLPGGQVKAAVGGTYESDNVVGIQYNEAQAAPIPGSFYPTAAPLIDPEPFDVWAAFVQLDVPVFGDNFNIPLFRRLDLEASWRHDQYNQSNGALNGGTSNPKIGLTWLLDEMTGTTIRGSWGTSFRFANLGETSTVLSDQWDAANVPGGPENTAISCSGSPAAPPPGSAAADLVATGLFGCGGQPGGIEWGGGPHPVLRVYTDPSGNTLTREGGTSLSPEKSINYSAGIEIAPTISFLRGLDLQATYYSIKINGVINPFNFINDTALADPTTRFTFILPSDLGCPVADNANPTACAPFEKMVVGALTDFNATVNLDQAPNIYYIRDGATTNSGFYHLDGIDFNASYDWDMGDYGVWNAGITGTYYLHYYVQAVAGAPVVDYLHVNLGAIGSVSQQGVESQPRMQWRARLGWTSGPYSVTGFVNYISHYYDSTTVVPPNVNDQCTSSGGTVGGGTYPCAINSYSDLLPSMYTFDLSLGYNTGDMPTNDYLKNITLQLTFQNILDKHPAFAYGPVTSHRNAAGYDILKPDTGRIIGLTIEKQW